MSVKLLKINVSDNATCNNFNIDRIVCTPPIYNADKSLSLCTSHIVSNSNLRMCMCLYKVQVVKFEHGNQLTLLMPHGFMNDFIASIDARLIEIIQKNALDWFKKSINVHAIEECFKATVRSSSEKRCRAVTARFLIDNDPEKHLLKDRLKQGREYDLKIFLSGIQFGKQYITPVWHVCTAEIIKSDDRDASDEEDQRHVKAVDVIENFSSDESESDSNDNSTDSESVDEDTTELLVVRKNGDDVVARARLHCLENLSLFFDSLDIQKHSEQQIEKQVQDFTEAFSQLLLQQKVVVA